MDNSYWNPMVPELTVSDFQRALFFYQTVLGFRIRHQRTEPGFAYLELEQVHLMIEQYHADGWRTGELVPPYGRGVNFQMEVSDIEPVLARLRAHRIALFREPRESWYGTGALLSGQREFLVQDPDGYLLRFTQFLGEKAKT